MSIEVPFTKANLEYYLKELAKEFRKRGHGAPAELTLVGGASVLLNYDFRYSSYDIDADYTAVHSVMKECINAVGDRLGLPIGWLNDDFKRTASYTPRLAQYSAYYKTFSGVLEVRTVKAEYLVAMKLKSGRKYKKDLSDVAGILYEQQLSGDPLTYERIDRAACNLYGGWNAISEGTKDLLNRILACEDLRALFVELSEDEQTAKDALMEVEKKYPSAVKEDTADSIIAIALQKKKEREGR